MKHNLLTKSLAIGVAALVAASVAPPATQAQAADDDRSAFTLAVLPDTQFYSRYADSNFIPDYGTTPFHEQTAWIAENADELNIPFAVHVGDVVDVVGQESGWRAADESMQNLDDAGIPYAILAGNHDVRNSSNNVVDTDYDLADEPFLQTFPVERAAAHDAFIDADPTGLNRYSIFEAEGQRYLVLSLNWRVSDATLAWASDVLAAHSDLPTIIASHDIISIQNDGVTGETSPNGERIWDALINDNDQVFLTLNGHYHGSAKVERQNAAGNTVTQILTDHQMAYEGGNGYMNLLEFDITNGQINVNTVSPWVVSKPDDKLTSYDTPVLTGANEQYSIPIDFESRFDDFSTVDATHGDLSARAIEILTDGFEGAPESALLLAGNKHDYVEAEGTLAHWQLTGEAGTVAEGQVFDDLAGDSDLYREAIDASGSATAQLDDVTIVDDAQTYSPSQQAVCFSDSSRERFSYLTTAPDAEVNNADLSSGYTIETFVMLDADWASDINGWSKALTRSGNRSQIEGMPWSQWDYTASPAALGISNLREFQWTEIGQDATRGDKTNWSGEILTGTWSHVALVNDPETATTVMYVNGAPVLRTAQDTAGMSFNEGMPWILGADWVDDRATNGWHGCIGETRIVDRPLGAAEWLTARPDLNEFSAEAAVDGDTVTLSGAGLPNAEILVDDPSVGVQDDAVSADARAAVSEDGTWSVQLSAAVLAAGSNADGVVTLGLAQAFGDRASDAVELDVQVADAEAPGESDEPGESEEPGGSDQPDAPDPSDAESEGSADSGLPETGMTPGLVVPMVALAALLAGGVLMRLRRPSAG